MSDPAATDRVRVVYERLAEHYDRGMGFMERLMRIAPARRWVASRARGATLEIGFGTGLDLPYYAADVELTGIDLSAAMLARARRRAEELRRAVTLREADAEALPFADATFDTVVFALCLCSIPDEGHAVREAVRVLRPGGRLLLLEHVRSSHILIRAVQRMLDPLSVRFQADHLTREPLHHVRGAGLQAEEATSWAWGIMQRACAQKPAG